MLDMDNKIQDSTRIDIYLGRETDKLHQ